jgi:hypothetical protein
VIVRGYVVTESDIAVGGEQACGLLQILDSDGYAVQGSQGITTHQRIACLAGSNAGTLEISGRQRINGRVYGMDARDARIQYLKG